MNYSRNSAVAAIHEVPGKALGIWSLSLAVPVPVVGLVLGIVALGQSRRAGVPNNLAVAGTIISLVLTVGAAVTSIVIWA